MPRSRIVQVQDLVRARESNQPGGQVHTFIMSARIENLRIIADYSSPRFTPHYNCELCQPSQPFAALLLHVLICHVPGDSYTLHVSRVGTRPVDTFSGGQWSPVCGNTANTGPGSLCVCVCVWSMSSIRTSSRAETS